MGSRLRSSRSLYDERITFDLQHHPAHQLNIKGVTMVREVRFGDVGRGERAHSGTSVGVFKIAAAAADAAAAAAD